MFATKRAPDLVLGAVGGVLTIPRARFSQLAGPANAILLQDKATAKKIVLIRDGSGYFALSSTCTHIGCDVDYGVAVHRIVCPCHGSEYDLEGRNLKGPAKRPLKRYTVRVDADQIRIQT